MQTDMNTTDSNRNTRHKSLYELAFFSAGTYLCTRTGMKDNEDTTLLLSFNVFCQTDVHVECILDLWQCNETKMAIRMSNMNSYLLPRMQQQQQQQ